MVRKNRRGKNRRDKNAEPKARTPYQEGYTESVLERGNFKMECYYALQGMHNHYYSDQGELLPCKTDEEKEAERLRWRNIVGEILPSSFRMAHDAAESLKQQLETELQELLKAAGDELPNVKKIHFLPHAYQMGMGKKAIRKNEALQNLHSWLVQQTNTGFITRQETVSMIPPVVLAPEATDSVLDMCAAPGSKTCQLLEQLNETGCMVANDANAQRAYMLVHQLRRIMHNNPVVLITSCEAQRFPETLSFDRVLSDVPCSGDGTSRKNIGIWKKWGQVGALALHALQVDISWKGAALLKVGGHMCYSTCSFNPIENEAVVAELLRRSKGSLELVDYKLSGFKTRPGWSTWKVMCEDRSNKEIKDKLKKNNDKMRRKREEWAKKETEEKKEGKDEDTKEMETTDDAPEKLEQDDTKKDEPAGQAETEDKAEEDEAPGDMEIDKEDKTKSDQMETEEAKGTDDNGEDNVKQWKARRFENIPSWDDETLIGLADSVGLSYYKTFEDVPGRMRNRIRESCFPPTDEEAKTFHLERCIRCMPQDEDTGGFFVALLKKVAPITAKEVKAATSTTNEDTEVVKEAEEEEVQEQPETKRVKPNPEIADPTITTAQDPEATTVNNDDAEKDEKLPDKEENKEDAAPLRGVVKGNYLRHKDGKGHKDLGRDDFIAVSDDILDPLIEFYGLSNGFPKDQYMARACGEAKVLYYIGESVKKNYIDKGLQTRITIVNSGVKGFARNTKACGVAYRVAQEGVHFLAPYMTKRKVVIGLDDFRTCLQQGVTIDLKDFSEDFQNQVKPITTGSMVVVLKGYEDDYTRKFLLTMWRCRAEAVNCLVNKDEIDGVKSKLAGIEEEAKQKQG